MKNDSRTFSLDLLALGKGEVGGEEIVVVYVGHDFRRKLVERRWNMELLLLAAEDEKLSA